MNRTHLNCQLAFPVGDKLLTGHGWHKCRPKGDMTCLPCLHPRRMDKLYRSSTVFRKPSAAIRKTVQLPWSRSYRGHRPDRVASAALGNPALSSVELLQSSNIPNTTARQGSRFTPPLPCQVLLPFRGRDRSTWRQCLLMRYRNRSHDLVAVSASSVYCAAMFRVIGMCRARLLCNPSPVVRKTQSG